MVHAVTPKCPLSLSFLSNLFSKSGSCPPSPFPLRAGAVVSPAKAGALGRAVQLLPRGRHEPPGCTADRPLLVSGTAFSGPHVSLTGASPSPSWLLSPPRRFVLMPPLFLARSSWTISLRPLSPSPVSHYHEDKGCHSSL